jgi:serine/threonine protein kinase
MMSELSPGQIVGRRYELQHPLGQGGMGTTWAALDLQTRQPVAVKALSVRSLRDWKALELFEREARVLRDLDHPGIPTYIDAIKLEDQGGDAFCLVQEKVEGQHLATASPLAAPSTRPPAAAGPSRSCTS